MEKRKKDGCETSRNRQKKETGKRNRIVLLAGAGIVAAALLTRRTYAWMQGKNPDHAGSF